MLKVVVAVLPTVFRFQLTACIHIVFTRPCRVDTISDVEREAPYAYAVGLVNYVPHAIDALS